MSHHKQHMNLSEGVQWYWALYHLLYFHLFWSIFCLKELSTFLKKEIASLQRHFGLSKHTLSFTHITFPVQFEIYNLSHSQEWNEFAFGNREWDRKDKDPGSWLLTVLKIAKCISRLKSEKKVPGKIGYTCFSILLSYCFSIPYQNPFG